MSDIPVGLQDKTQKGKTMHRSIVESSLSKFVDLDDFTQECIAALVSAYSRADFERRPTFGLVDIAMRIIDEIEGNPHFISNAEIAEIALRRFVLENMPDGEERSELSPRIDQDVTGFITNCHAAAASIGESVSFQDLAESLVVFITGEDEDLDSDPFEMPPELEELGGHAEPSRDGERRPGSSEVAPFCRERRGRPIVGREDEISRLAQALTLFGRSCVCLVGPSGVGKRSVIAGLVDRVARGEVPSALKDLRIFSLDPIALMAGTHMRGELEGRIGKLVRHFETNENHVLLIEEMQSALVTKANAANELGAALRPLFGNPNLKIVGTIPDADWRRAVASDPSIARLFRRIEIDSPNQEETRLILEGATRDLARHHRTAYCASALDAASYLPSQFMARRAQPEIGIEILDEAGALRRSRNEREVADEPVDAEDVRRVVSTLSGIPVTSLVTSDREMLDGLSEALSREVVGQARAVEAVTRAVRRARAQVVHREGPEGSFLFIGPTGCGKTSLAIALARHTKRKFVRFDMSEYQEQHSVSRLIGAPPGYVGYDRGGLLTEAVEKNPHCILLLDEIEKAHPSIFAVLLQIMDAGRLTDSRGETTDFRKVMLILSTNAGMDKFHSERPQIGFSGRSETDKSDYDERAIADTFKAEFRNRLDAEILFEPIRPAIMEDVVTAALAQLEARITLKKVKIEIDDEAKRWFATKGYKPKYGARPLKRLLEREIVDPISDARIATGRDDFHLCLRVENDELHHVIV